MATKADGCSACVAAFWGDKTTTNNNNKSNPKPKPVGSLNQQDL